MVSHGSGKGEIELMWILVLIFKLSSAGGITSIPDFPTEKACIETGKQWAANSSTFGADYYYKCIHADIKK